MRWKKFLAGLLLFVLMIVTVLTVSAEEAAGSLMENLHYTIQTMDGGTVTTVAEGKPKVLIFYKPNCFNCQTVLGLFQNEELNFSGVDVIAAEISGASMDDMQDFYDMYGTEQLAYGYNANSIMWTYLRRLGISGSVTTPAIIFIDKNDQVVHYTTGMNREIMSDIETYLNVSLSGGAPSQPENPWEAEVDTSWYESSKEEFILNTPEQLAGLAQLVNGGNTFEGKTICLGADMYFNDKQEAQNPWTPIASSESGVEFQGTFDGQGHTLYYLYLAANSGGLFGTIGEKGIVKAVKIGQGYIRSGAAVAETNKGWILFCENQSDISSNASYTGGICSQNENLIYGCGNSGSINAGRTAGGITGNNASFGATIDSCWNEGTVKSSSLYLGGIAGESIGWIFNCYNSGNISGDCTAAGGITGIQKKELTGQEKLYNCYNIGEISGNAAKKDTISGIMEGNYANVYAAPSQYNNLAEVLTLDQFKDPDTVEKLQGDLVIPKWTGGTGGINGGYIVNVARKDMEEGIYKMLPDIWNPVKEINIGMGNTGEKLDAFLVAYYGAETVDAVYSTKDTDILSITSDGIVSPKKSGTAVVRVTFPESEHGKETWFDVTVTVDGSSLKGDADGSGKVDIADLRLVLRAVCGKVELTDAQTSAADVETDGKVDIQDLRKILRFVCGKIETL